MNQTSPTTPSGRRRRLAAFAVGSSALMAAATVLAASPVLASGGGPLATPGSATYRVTLVNLTHGQPFSPPVAATHRKTMHMFQVGGLASDQLAAIAQGGDELAMFNLFSGDAHVTDVVDVARPLTPSGTQVGSFTDTVSFEIDARPGDRLSLSTMLICTNDGFLGLDAVKLPDAGSATHLLAGYDAGRERNTQVSQDLVDPCSGLNPSMPLPGDPDGNIDTGAVLTIPAQTIRLHPGIIAGVGELTPGFHGWVNPVARVVVTRL